MNKNFAHLHLHTQYSFLDGTIRIKDLINKILELKMNTVAITDHGNMFGVLDFYLQTKQAGIKPIIGIEAYITSKVKHTDRIKENFHLILLAENNIGYYNLKKLTSISFLYGKYYHPRIDKKLLKKYSEGLIALTACLSGEIGKKCANNDINGARNAIKEFKSIFGPNNFFLEIQPNGLEIQNKVNADLKQLAKEEGLQLAATNDCHYIKKEDFEAQNILMAIRQQKNWNDPTLYQHKTDAFYVRSEEEMENLLKNDFIEAFENTCKIAKRCNVEIDVGNSYLPTFNYPNLYKDESDYLKHITIVGLEKRFLEIPYKIEQTQYKIRLNHELSIITKMGFSGYFLIVQDFINWSKKNNIKVGPGRGSGAGSIVAYALRITDLDPIPYNLLFERFLNPQRISMPDFDIDFMQEGRASVIKYVTHKYGKNHVGQIATYSALNPKSAIKDVARILGIPFSEINELIKPIPLLINGKKPDFKQALKHAPKLKQKATINKDYKHMLRIAESLEGLFRQVGTHAGGIVISDKTIINYAPIFSSPNGDIVTQFDKDKVIQAGLVKFDFLGLKTLDVINHAEFLINIRIKKENKLSYNQLKKAIRLHPHIQNNEKKIKTLHVEYLQPNSKKVYKMISSGNTLGIFQMESEGFQDLCKKLKPDCFEDIIAAVALYRPGPMQSGMVKNFISRKHGKKKVTYPHQKLKTILAPTYGTFIYQEQVMQSAQVLAGYNLSDADILRRAMGKKKFEEMKQQRKIFYSGAKQNGVNLNLAKKIFDTIEKFAGYAFNKSHSTAYAALTYQTAYLKSFYPVEFMTALLTTSSNSTNDIVKYINESKKTNIKILPPDINISKKGFTVDYNPKIKNKQSYGEIRFGLNAIKGIGDKTLNTIIKIRKKKGLYKNIMDLCNKLSTQHINKKTLEALIASGALDSFNINRNKLFQNIEKSLIFTQKIQKDTQNGQINMFNPLTASYTKKITTPEWSKRKKLKLERQSLGFYLSGHPLDNYIREIKQLKIITTEKLISCYNLQKIQMVGIIVKIKERFLKKRNGKWAILTIEDKFGQIEVLCFSNTYKNSKTLLQDNEPILIKGYALIGEAYNNEQKIKPKIKLKKIVTLKQIKLNTIKYVNINIKLIRQNKKKSYTILNSIKKICTNYIGKKPIKLTIQVENKYIVNIQCNKIMNINANKYFLNKIKNISNIITINNMY